MQWVAYILLCADGTYYSGSTNNFVRRLREHNILKSGSKYTRARRPVTLVYSEICLNLSMARKRENELKKLTHAQKRELSQVYSQV